MKMKKTTQSPTAPLSTEEVETDDLSVLRMPVKTMRTGFNEAHYAYENGTDEIRLLLSNECDVIYECKCCRNMFRSLTNFISHKRVYCRAVHSQSRFNHSNNGNNGFCQDITTIVQAEKEFITTARNGRGSDKDLNSIIDRLAQRETADRILQIGDFYEQVNRKLTEEEILQKKHILHLDRVPDTKVAVYQTFTDANEPVVDTMKTEMLEVRQLLDDKVAVLDEDGKVISTAELVKIPDRHIVEEQYECEICQGKFATERTLRLHLKMKHILSTYVFQCPVCSRRFLGVGCVIRHLATDHKKSMRRVRLLRESILRRRTRIDEIQNKGPSRELARLQTDRERNEAENKAWFDTLESDDGNVCAICNKKFERKAVLVSHLKVCQLKKKTTTRSSKRSRRLHNDVSNDSSEHHSIDTEPQTNGQPVNGEPQFDAAEPILINKRKRGRAMKYVATNNPTESDDDQPLIKHKNDSVEPKAKSKKPNEERNLRTKSVIKAEPKNEITAISIANRSDEALPKAEMPAAKKITVDSKKKDRRVEKVRGKLASNQCKYCLKKFSNASNLRRHITMSHMGPAKFSCDLCVGDEVYRARKKMEVISHIRSMHSFNGERSDALKFITIVEESTIEHPINGNCNINNNNDNSNSSISSTSTSNNNTPNINHNRAGSGGSINRRKDRHTSVLKDDVEIFFGDDVDELILNDAIENGNADGIDEEGQAIQATSTNRTANEAAKSVKRKGRPKATDKPKQSERSQLLGDKDGNEVLPTRRPIRNRRIHVKHDFVYDLSTILKNKNDFRDVQNELPKADEDEQQSNGLPSSEEQSLLDPNVQSQATHEPNQLDDDTPMAPSNSQKLNSGRRSASIEVDETQQVLPEIEIDDSEIGEPSIVDEQSQSKPKVVTATALDPIRGAADLMARFAIEQNGAAISKPLLASTEQLMSPFFRHSRKKHKWKDWPYLKQLPPKLRAQIVRARLADLEMPEMRRRKRNERRKLKPKTEPKTYCNANASTSSNVGDVETDHVKISTRIADRIQMEYAKFEASKKLNLDNAIKTEQLSDDSQTSPSTSSSTLILASVLASVSAPATPLPSTMVKSPLDPTPSASSSSLPRHKSAESIPRRMTLLERLAENKTKKLNESLSRMSLQESSDIESEEENSSD